MALSNVDAASDREMYYNIRTIKDNKRNISKHILLKRNVAGPEVPEPVCDGQPFGSASPEGGCGQTAFGNGSAPTLRFEWITAQWQWRRPRQRDREATRIAVTMTFMLPEEIGTQQAPHRITFYLTDRWREFQPANLFQRQIHQGPKTTWIGKARVRQRAGQEVHRHNIPDLVMTAWDSGGVLQAQVHSPQQTIDLRFDQPVTERQQPYYMAAAAWGRVQRPPRARDEFYDWLQYA